MQLVKLVLLLTVTIIIITICITIIIAVVFAVAIIKISDYDTFLWRLSRLYLSNC